MQFPLPAIRKKIPKMKNNYRLEKVDSLVYTDEDWKRYFYFRTKSCALQDEPMPFDSVEVLKKNDLELINKEGYEIYQVWKNEQEHNIFCFSPASKDDLEKRFTYLINQMNNEYLEPHLLVLILNKFVDYDEKSNYLSVHSTKGLNDHISNLQDVYVGYTSGTYGLNVEEANMEKIDTCLTEALTKFPNLNMVFYAEIPANLLEEYAALLTQLVNDIPPISDGDKTNYTAEIIKEVQEATKLRNYCTYRYMIFNETHQLIATTNVFINLKKPEEVYQLITGVLKKYRGRGLGKWLKAVMFKKLVADFPKLEKIETVIDVVNHPSRELSKQMGFKMVGTNKEWKIKRANVLQYLDVLTN